MHLSVTGEPAESRATGRIRTTGSDVHRVTAALGHTGFQGSTKTVGVIHHRPQEEKKQQSNASFKSSVGSGDVLVK